LACCNICWCSFVDERSTMLQANNASTWCSNLCRTFLIFFFRLRSAFCCLCLGVKIFFCWCLSTLRVPYLVLGANASANRGTEHLGLNCRSRSAGNKEVRCCEEIWGCRCGLWCLCSACTGMAADHRPNLTVRCTDGWEDLGRLTCFVRRVGRVKVLATWCMGEALGKAVRMPPPVFRRRVGILQRWGR
jgi:hypothetical protein